MGIPKSKLGEMKFPHHDLQQVHGEVNTFFIPLEEVTSKYGESPKKIFTKEMYLEMKKKRWSLDKIAEKTGLSREQVYYLSNQYAGFNKKCEKKEQEKVDVTGLTLETFTKEKYLELKKAKFSDEKIAKILNSNARYLFLWKRANGLVGVTKKTIGQQNVQAI